jgi:hypothetical protein
VALLAKCFMLISCLAYSSTLKRKTPGFSEMSVPFQRATRRYIPENRSLHNKRRENLKSHVNLGWCRFQSGLKICRLVSSFRKNKRWTVEARNGRQHCFPGPSALHTTLHNIALYVCRLLISKLNVQKSIKVDSITFGILSNFKKLHVGRMKQKVLQESLCN